MFALGAVHNLSFIMRLFGMHHEAAIAQSLNKVTKPLELSNVNECLKVHFDRHLVISVKVFS